MSERPILMSAPMVRAILDGRKSQTRRVVKIKRGGTEHVWPLPDSIEPHDSYPGEWSPWIGGERHHSILCPYGAPGDRLWVRETWWCYDDAALEAKDRDGVVYRADLRGQDEREERAMSRRLRDKRDHWRPSLYMPRWASRITLEVTGVRVERLQDISTSDCWAEGIPPSSDVDPVHEYRDLWDSINGAGSWGANPWVWVVDFVSASTASAKGAGCS